MEKVQLRKTMSHQFLDSQSLMATNHRKTTSMSKVTPPRRVLDLTGLSRKSPYASNQRPKRQTDLQVQRPDLSQTMSYSLNGSFGETDDGGRAEATKLEMRLAALQEEADVPTKKRDRFQKYMQILEEIVAKNKPFSSLLRQIKSAIEWELGESQVSSVGELEVQNKRLAQMVSDMKSRVLRDRQEREQREMRISAIASDNSILRDKAEELEKLLSSCPTSGMSQSKSKDAIGPFMEESKIKTRRIKELEDELSAYKRREEKLMQLLERTQKEGVRRHRSKDLGLGSPSLEVSEGSESEFVTPMPSRRTERSQHAAS